MIEEFARKIDLNNTDHFLLYGSDAQKKIADFSDSALATVRTNDTGEVGEMLVKLVNESRASVTPPKSPRGLAALFWNAKKAVSDMQTKYDKVEVNVDAIALVAGGLSGPAAQGHQPSFNHLYDMNTEYFKELTMYILAGEKRLAEVRRTTLEELKARAAQSGDAMDAQRANDMAANCDRF